MPIPVSQALEGIYEHAIASRNRLTGRLNISTVHAAKGREFKHVLILDGGDWQSGPRGEERRLYYVGMTRARETLTLSEALERPNPFTQEIEDGECLLRMQPQDIPMARGRSSTNATCSWDCRMSI